MKLDLKAVFKEKTPFEFSFETKVLDRSSGGTRLTGAPLKITGKVTLKAGAADLLYTLKMGFSGRCDLCLSEFEKDYGYDIEHILVTSVESENYPDDYIVCPDGILDLGELALSDLFLNLPSVFLCSDDCKGLCLKCGKNLNRGNCGCADIPETGLSPFSKLKTLLNDED